MEPTTSQNVETVADAQPVHIDGTIVRIDDLTIDRQSIVDYLRSIHPSKQEIALVHALEVGVAELAARRGRAKQ